MKIEPIKTGKIVGTGTIEEIIDQFVEKIEENSILAITSKVISICEGNVIDAREIDKNELAYKEADLFVRGENKFGAILTIKNNILIPTAGIDESNGDGKLVLWPEDPQKSANKIRKYLCQKFSIKNIGVIITDSKTNPLRWGTTGISIAYSGFKPLNSYIGSKDLFGRKMTATKANIADGLAACAVLVMGEGSEQTPMAIISEIPFVQFKHTNPTRKELENLRIDIVDDLYKKILTSVKWENYKGQ